MKRDWEAVFLKDNFDRHAEHVQYASGGKATTYGMSALPLLTRADDLG